ncbi:MAG: ABC transporter permease, partial [Acidobacteriota bacterium]|nr:ABC transporter permease [Acidobacteriota bacterium]
LWLTVSTEGFSLLNLLTHASLWAILGLAAASVIVGRGIDISIGSMVALSAASAAMVLKLPYSPEVLIPVAILAGLLAGTAAGVLNAVLALLGGLHPIVVTLGTLTIYRGLVIAMLGGKPMTGLPPEFGRLAIDPATGFRGAVVVAALVVLLVYLWMAHTPGGRHVYALGSSPRAAGLLGLSRARLWPVTFGLGGLLAGVAGVLQLSMGQQMQARLGAGWELSAIAVAVIGGVAITGGRGTVLGVVLGALLLRLVNSALVRWGVSDQQTDLVVGSLILAALLLDLAWRGWKR